MVFRTQRARIGLLIPSVNVTMETDFQHYLPRGVMANAHRIFRHSLQSTLSSGNRLLDDSVEAARALAHATPDVVVFGCTSATVLEGAGGDRLIAQRLEDTIGVPVVTTATAVVDALRALQAERIAVATPYRDEINESEREFFEGSGFDVASIHGMGILESLEIPRVSPGAIYRFVRDHVDKSADAVFVSCTNFRAWETLPFLESDLGLPVVTSNQASMWAALRLIGLRDEVPSGGRLFAEGTRRVQE